jgi:hypothetical protein
VLSSRSFALRGAMAMIRREMGHFDWRIPGDVRILIGVICSHHASWLM